MATPSEGHFVLIFAALIGYPVGLGAGIPTYLLFQHRKWTGLLPYLLASGAFSGMLVGVLIFPLHLTKPGVFLIDLISPTPLAQMAALAAAVTTSIIVFWLIDRPDRAFPHPFTGEVSERSGDGGG